VVYIETDSIIELYRLLEELNCSPKEKIKIREIFENLELEDFKEGSIYAKIYQKTHVEESTLKKMITKKKNCNTKIIELCGKKNPKNKEVLYELYKKIIREKNNE
jgi:hypothetical protein